VGERKGCDAIRKLAGQLRYSTTEHKKGAIPSNTLLSSVHYIEDWWVCPVNFAQHRYKCQIWVRKLGRLRECSAEGSRRHSLIFGGRCVETPLRPGLHWTKLALSWIMEWKRSTALRVSMPRVNGREDRGIDIRSNRARLLRGFYVCFCNGFTIYLQEISICQSVQNRFCDSAVIQAPKPAGL
jgi:hypothetical protein